MPEEKIIKTSDVRAYLDTQLGREITLDAIRKEFNILSGTKSFDAVRNILFQLAEQKMVRPSGTRSGVYKVVTPANPVIVFGRSRKPVLDITFPRDFQTMMEFSFASDIVLRGGDLILISGRSNYGKTTLCMNFLAENLDASPVLMGNEYTTLDNEPSPRFLNRLDNMDWVTWDNEGHDRFVLLPVREDYAEHIVKDKINIIDWINLDEHYLISKVMEGIKRPLGNGIGVIAIQKAEGALSGRGGQFTKDFADLEILLDEYGHDGVLLTLGKVKEAKRSLSGKHYAFSIEKGVRIVNFREVRRCSGCHGTKVYRGNECEMCLGIGFVEV